MPNRAIRRRGVQMLVNGKPETKQARLGIAGEVTIEFVEGLQQGDQVIVNAPATAGGARPGAGGGGGGRDGR